MNEQEFHAAIEKKIGTPKQRYQTVVRGRRRTRKPIASEHLAKWSEGNVTFATKKINITVYLNLQKNSLNTSDYVRLKQLAIDGISQYWSRIINLGTANFSVNVTVQQRTYDAIQADLYINSSDEFGRSFNIGILCIDASFIYNDSKNLYSSQFEADSAFKLICAHEFGHSVLQYFGGNFLSWSHKDSTYIIPQSIKPTTPGFPASGEIDLMKYYDDKKTRATFARQIANSHAAEEDVMRLIWSSILTF